jgi:uncharacterized membrane protein YkvA (DUF1232 family)
MSNEPKQLNPAQTANILTETVRTLRLVWRLLNDTRVSLWPKLIIPATLAYVIWPVDFLPDVIPGLGQLDDLAIVLLGVALFIELCPKAIVEEIRRELRGSANASQRSAPDVVDASYRVIPDEQKKA